MFGSLQQDEIKKQKREKRAEIFGTPEHEQILKQKRKKHAEMFGTPEHDKIKNKKRKLFHDKKYPKISSERISNFLKLVNEGPYYIYVV